MVCYYCYASQWFCYRSNQRLLKDQNASFIDAAHAQVSTLFWNLVLKFPWKEALKTELSLIIVSLSKSSWCQEVYIATRGILCPPPHTFLDNTKKFKTQGGGQSEQAFPAPSFGFPTPKLQDFPPPILISEYAPESNYFIMIVLNMEHHLL